MIMQNAANYYHQERLRKLVIRHLTMLVYIGDFLEENQLFDKLFY
jgi:hypothetical protein